MTNLRHLLPRVELGPVTLGSYLRDARCAAHLGLREVSARIGMSAVVWGEIERGKRTLWPWDLERVFRAVPGVELDVLAHLANVDNQVRRPTRAP